MKESYIASKIEHTNISPKANWKDIRKLCQEAIKYQFRSVVVFPEWVHECRERLEGTSIKTVSIFLFPHQSKPVISDYADEIDVFMDFRYVDSRRIRMVAEQKLRGIANIISHRPVKIIVETSFLDDRELTLATRLVKKYGFAFVKSSSGLFKRARSQKRNLEIMKKALVLPVLTYTKRGIKPFAKIKVSTKFLKLSKFLFKLRGLTIRCPYLKFKSPKIKIAGGIHSYRDAETLVKNGADLLGASKSVDIIEKTMDKEIAKAKEMREKTITPETVKQHIKESKKSPEFRKAYDKEKTK